jgi:hypothetical protein
MIFYSSVKQMKPSFSVTTNIQIFSHDILRISTEQRKRCIIATYVAWGILAPVCNATSVIVIIEQDKILIGADSLWKNSQLQSKLQCKIDIPRQACSFAIVGMRTNPTGFDPAAIAAHECGRNSPLTEIATSFAESVRKPLAQALEYSRINDPVAYERDYRGKVVLEIVFAGFYQGKPTGAVKTFLVDRAGNLTENQVATIPDGAGNSMAILGPQKAVKQFFSQNPGWKAIPHPRLIHLLINRVIATNPDTVGRPISILAITRSGQIWVEEGKCGPPDQ